MLFPPLPIRSIVLNETRLVGRKFPDSMLGLADLSSRSPAVLRRPIAGRQNSEGHAHGARNESGPQQSRIIRSQPSVVLGEAELQKIPSGNVAERAVTLHLEAFLRRAPAERRRVPGVLEELARDYPGAAGIEEGTGVCG
jgi:hypothetical protein